MTRGRRRFFITVALLLCAATTSRTALAAPCDPAYVRAHHKTVTVLPSGGDDTANLQCAIDQATARGRGAIVQLLRGTYQTQQLLISALHGTLRGAGRERTVLRNPDVPVPIDNPVPWEAGPPAPDNRYPVLLSVIGGDVVLSDLSIEIVGTNVTGDWYWGTFGPLNFFVPALFVYGSHTALRAERIGISGASACFPEPGDVAEFARDLQGRLVAPLVVPCRDSRDHSQRAHLRQGRRQLFGDPVREPLLLRIAAQVLEREHRQRPGRLPSAGERESVPGLPPVPGHELPVGTRRRRLAHRAVERP